nr:MAG TPA: hypothetical protein [Inoviridae sp.]
MQGVKVSITLYPLSHKQAVRQVNTPFTAVRSYAITIAHAQT